MGFYFKRGDRTVLDGARRIAGEQLDSALKVITAPGAGKPEDVHALRKHCKKTRALLHLFYPVLKGAGRENAALRKAARQIAPLRDAEVRLGSFDLLVRELPAMPGLAELRAGLQDDLELARADDHLAAMAADLRAVRARCGDWRLRKRYAVAGTRKAGPDVAFAVLRPGLEATWRAARAGLAAARAELAGDFAAEPFHEWRKAAKNHWFQARLLAPIWPEMMAPHVAAADALGEFLGDHNDLDVLCTHLAGRIRAKGSPAECIAALAALEKAAMRPRRLLAERAVALGERLFAPQPDVLTALWGSWWAAWRR